MAIHLTGMDSVTGQKRVLEIPNEIGEFMCFDKNVFKGIVQFHSQKQGIINFKNSKGEVTGFEDRPSLQLTMVNPSLVGVSAFPVFRQNWIVDKGKFIGAVISFSVPQTLEVEWEAKK